MVSRGFIPLVARTNSSEVKASKAKPALPRSSGLPKYGDKLLTGFTLIEVLAVTAITVILGILLVANTREPARKFDLRRGAQVLVADLRRAQGYAVTPQRVSCGTDLIVPGYGFRVEAAAGQSASYTIFADCDRNNLFNPAGSDDFAVASNVMDLVAVNSTVPASGGGVFLEIVFVPPSPDVAVNGSVFPYPAVGTFEIQLCHVADSSLCTSVKGNTRGNIEIE